MTLKALLLGGLALAAPAVAQPAGPPMLPMSPMMMQGARLDVVADGEVTRAPDLVTIGAGVVTQAATAGEALRDNAARMAATTAALRKAGVADRDIQTSSINLSPQYRYGENVPPVITGYQATNTVSVRFRDVARAGAILDTLVAQGANQINGPSFSLDKADAALDEARARAIATARARATLYANAAGLRVKRIVSISEAGGSSPAPMPMMAMSMRAKSADTAIEPGEQKLVVSVSVSFELE